MKNKFIFIATATFIFSTVLIKAQIVLTPGSDKVFTNQSATGGEAGNNGNFLFTINSNYDASSKTIKAEVNGGPASIGKGEAYSLIYYDFQISETPETYSNTVGAWISYDVFWSGFQEILALILSNSYVKIEMILKDQTSNQLIKNEVIHDLDLKTFSYKIITAGLELNDTDTKINTIPIVLRRGHNYRLHLKLTATLIITAGSSLPSYSDYMDGLFGGGDGRVELRNLLVKVGLDEKFTLEKLATLDSLENRIDSLEYKLEHHYHTYLTGRGNGHNNTEANTTLSIFEEGINPGGDPSIYYESQENYVPDESLEIKSVPDDFSVGQNYPNPFNPSTTISFAIPEQELVTVKVFDVLGRLVEILVNEVKTPGYYEVNFNAYAMPSGTYIYEIRAGSFTETKKMILMK